MKKNKGWENLKPAQPGEVRNPEGRKTAGAYIKEHVNSMACRKLTKKQLRKIIADEDEDWTRVAAAEQALRSMESPDIADFQEVVRGTKTPDDLRKAGIDTAAIKKYTIGKKGISVELHNRAGESFDRVVEKTDGKDPQAVDVTSGNKPLSTDAALTQALTLLGIGAGQVPKPVGE